MPYNKGANKAKAAMRKKYGSRWKAIYYGRAMKFGKGKSPHAKANSIYGKGKHTIKRSRKTKTRR